MSEQPLPKILQPILDKYRRAYRERLGASAPPPELDDPGWRAELDLVWGASDFVARSCSQEPEFFHELLASGDLSRRYEADEYKRRVAVAIAGTQKEEQLMAALRGLRRREMVRIAWRDIAGRAQLGEVTEELSAFADAVVEGALTQLHLWRRERYGLPVSKSGQKQDMVVIAMGKLGARELNFSSDIDLIFAYSEGGSTTGGAKQVSNEEYFVRLGQRLIHALNQQTADGFVFRVDMRLRPFGSSGALAASFDAMESYYQTHGREWERYAWIKARPIAGDLESGRRLLGILRPFVYRRYLDFGAFQALREMKALIAGEVTRKGLADDVKLGPGGIREVEFLAQAFQLIRGGRLPALQTRGLLPVLGLLGKLGYLPEDVVSSLSEAYVFLRDTEHRLQEVNDRQTQSLPEGEMEQARLAYAMGFPDWTSFRRTLEAHRARVQLQFEQVFTGAESGDEQTAKRPDLVATWEERLQDREAECALLEAGFDDPAGALRLLDGLRDNYGVRVMTEHARQRLDRLMPMLLADSAATAHPTETLRRLTEMVSAIARRSVYMALLNERPDARDQLVRLFSASPWIARHLTRFPLLLDELLDPRSLYHPSDRAGLEQAIEISLSNVQAGDTEQEMDALRVYKQAHVLRVAAADIVGALPLMKVSDNLTDIAEVLLNRALELARRDVTVRHGKARFTVDGKRGEAGFLIVAYGKLGGIELGYGSDLDLVFMHGSRGENQMTDGDRPVDNATYFARIGKRLTHLLTTPTGAGALYEVDYRLRPSGASGMLVSSMDAFASYQDASAWTWEHQALVRARPVCGDPVLGERFNAVRRRVLSRPRDPMALRTEVREMREKMRSNLGSNDPERFDLKQDNGGIADIEFMVQYGVLRWAHDHGAVLRYTDNIRILESFAAEGLMAEADTVMLMDAYRAYRSELHRAALREEKGQVPASRFPDYRTQVTQLWRRMMEP